MDQAVAPAIDRVRIENSIEREERHGGETNQCHIQKRVAPRLEQRGIKGKEGNGSRSQARIGDNVPNKQVPGFQRVVKVDPSGSRTQKHRHAKPEILAFFSTEPEKRQCSEAGHGLQQSDCLNAGQAPVQAGTFKLLLLVDCSRIAHQAAAGRRAATEVRGPPWKVPDAQRNVNGSSCAGAGWQGVHVKAPTAGIRLRVGRHLAKRADELPVGIDLVAGFDFGQGQRDVL